MTVGGGGGMEDKPKNVGGEGLFILIYEKRHNSVVVWCSGHWPWQQRDLTFGLPPDTSCLPVTLSNSWMPFSPHLSCEAVWVTVPGPGRQDQPLSLPPPSLFPFFFLLCSGFSVLVFIRMGRRKNMFEKVIFHWFNWGRLEEGAFNSMVPGAFPHSFSIIEKR